MVPGSIRFDEAAPRHLTIYKKGELNMVDLMIDMTEEPVDENDREFLYTNHLNVAQPVEHLNASIYGNYATGLLNTSIKGNYSFRTFGVPNDYYEIIRCSSQEETEFIRLANS